MAKKNWVYVKRGLLDDPKHREAMGEAVWLYLHLLDRANYEDGIVYDWKDEDEADLLAMPVTTLRHQRRRLERAGYITAQKGQHAQIIVIHNWTNPRSYSGKVVNKTPQNKDSQSDKKLSLSKIQSDNQSYNQSYNQSDNLLSPPIYINRSCINNQRERENGARSPAPDDSSDAPEGMSKHGAVRDYYQLTKIQPNIVAQQMIEREVKNKILWRKAIEYWVSNGYQASKVGKIIEKYHELEKTEVRGLVV